MVDITTYQRMAEDLVTEFYDLEENDRIDVSWGRTESFTTNDPFNRVQLRGTTIVIGYTVKKDSIWHIDLVRGLLVYYLPEGLRDTWSGWNLSTVIALTIIPSSQIADSIKTRYRELWQQLSESGALPDHRHNYDRWYLIMLAFNRVTATTLLRDFLDFYQSQGRSVESQLNQYLLEIDKKRNFTERVLVTTSLREQSMDVKTLLLQLPHYTKSTLYRKLSELKGQIAQYYMILPRQFGLSSVYLNGLDEDSCHALMNFPYYENKEKFKDQDGLNVKCWIPEGKLLEIVENYELPENIDYIERRLESAKLRINPLLYDEQSQNWQDAIDNTSLIDQVITITIPNTDKPAMVKREEIELAQTISLSGTTDWRKLSVKHSQSQTKRLVRKVLEKQMVVPLVLWRKPGSLDQLLVILPLQDWKSIDRTVPEVERQKKLFEQIMGIPWIYLSVEYGTQYKQVNDQNKRTIYCREVAFLRITCTKADTTWLRSRVDKVYTYAIPGGTNPRFPTDLYLENRWKFNDQLFVNSIRQSITN